MRTLVWWGQHVAGWEEGLHLHSRTRMAPITGVNQKRAHRRASLKAKSPESMGSGAKGEEEWLIQQK